MKLQTKLAQVGINFDKRTGAISVPIYQSATFCHPALGESTGYDYSRTLNPTRQALEESVAQLEEGHKGFAYSSGMAAISCVLSLFKQGDHIIVSDDLYGGTYRLFDKVFKNFGLDVSYVPTEDILKIEGAITSNSKAIFVETPTNPLMKISNLKEISRLAKQHNLLVIVDNTFLTPYYQRPLSLGADIVVHSATKYLGGHNDVVAGIVVARSEQLAEKICFLQNSMGAILGPQDSWLLLRGIKTLGIRLEKQQQNALEIARWLQTQASVEKVYYPGLKEHQGHKILKEQATGFGAMISFTVKRQELVPQILRKVKVISFAESLGGVESLITFPAQQTHGDIPVEIRESLGITSSLLRLSVGIEDAEDLIGDLKQALEVYKGDN